MSTSTTKRAVIYCRVSTKEQVDEGNSLLTQEKICKEYAIKQGYEIVKVFVEEGESAKTADRPELKRMTEFCTDRKNMITAVIAYKVDRISRNLADYIQIRLNLRSFGVEIKSTSEAFADDPAGRFMENMIANVAQFDNDVRTERCTGGMKEAMREGRYVWGASLGYSNIRINSKATIAPNEMAPLVRETFERIAANTHSAEEVRKYMAKKGLKGKKGKALAKSYFYRMLKNKVYAGWIAKFGELHQGLFEPIVSQELFEQVQRVLAYRKRKNLHYETEHPDFPLRRLVYSPLGSKLTGCWAQGRGRKYPYYMFHKDKANFRKEAFETAFKCYLDKFRLNKQHFDKLKAYVHKNLVQAMKDKYTEAKEIRKKIETLKENQNLLIQKNLQGVIADSVLKQQLDNTEYELMRLNALLVDLPERAKNYEQLLMFVCEFLQTPSETWEKASFKTKLKLQWFYFPKGICFQTPESRTREISRYFKAEMVFLGRLSSEVDLWSQTSNQSEIKEAFDKQLVNDLEYLAELKKSILEQ